MNIDFDALLTRLRSEIARMEQDVARIETMREEARALVERYHLEPGEIPSTLSQTQVPLIPKVLSPVSPSRRTIPKLSSSVERLSESRIEAFAQEVRGMTQPEAIQYVGEQLEDFQNADMVKIIIAGELTTGKRSNVSSHIYRLIVDSGRYEKVGPGRFRLIARASRDQGAGAISGHGQMKETGSLPLFPKHQEATAP